MKLHYEWTFFLHCSKSHLNFDGRVIDYLTSLRIGSLDECTTKDKMFRTIEIKKLLHLCFMSVLVSKNGKVNVTN